MIKNALKWKAKAETRGRKRCTSQRIDRMIAKSVRIDPTTTSNQIKDYLDLTATTVTIR